MDIKDFKEFRAAAERFIAEVYGIDGRSKPVNCCESTMRRKFREVAVDVLTAKYGNDPYDRAEKLVEEVHELAKEAFSISLDAIELKHAQKTGNHELVKLYSEQSAGDCYRMLWEMSDVISIVFQMIRNCSVACELDTKYFVHMMLQGCVYKHKMRENDPEWGHDNSTKE